MPKSKFIRMASAILMLLALVLPVASVTPAFAATSVTGNVVGSDAGGALGVPGITVALVRNSDASVIGATLTTGGGNYVIPAFTDQSGAFTLIFLDQRGCGASTAPLAGANAGLAGGAAVGGCPAADTGTAAAGTGCAANVICGYQPSVQPITLIGGPIAQSAGTLTLQPALAPTTVLAATVDGAFGSVVNLQGLGIGGLVVTATSLTAGATTPIAVATAFGTGQYVFTTLTPAANYTFTLSGPGVTAGTTLTPSNPGAQAGVGCTAVGGAAPCGGALALPTNPATGATTAWTTPGVAAGGGKYLNAGSFAIAQAVSSPAGRGFVTGTVLRSDGTPLGNVNVVLTDATGAVYATTTNGAGVFLFTGAGQNGQGVFTGTAKLVIADNANDYICPAGAACGFFPAASTSVTVTSGQTTNAGTFTLANKIAPATTEAALGAGGGLFGYVVNQNGQGIGGITVCGFLGTPVPIPACTPAIAPSTTSDAQTGRFRLPVATAGTWTVVISGPGVTLAGATASCVTPIPANSDGTNTCTDVAVTAAGLWTDPVFVVAIASPGTTVNPITGTGTITGQVIDAQGLPATGAIAVLYSLTTRQIVAFSTLANPGLNLTAGTGVACTTALSTVVFPIGTGAAGSGCGNPQVVGANGIYSFTGLTPGVYTVTILDDRGPAGGESGCAIALVPNAAGAVAPVPCGSLPATQSATVTSDAIITLNYQLGAKIAPGSTGAAQSAGTLCAATTVNATNNGLVCTPPATGTGIFGYVTDALGTGATNPAAGAVAGFQPQQGVRVYVLAAGSCLQTTVSFVFNVNNAVVCTSLQGVAGASTVLATATTDATGRYQMVVPTGLSAATTFDVAIELPQGANGCAPGSATGVAVVGGASTVVSPSGGSTVQLAPGPGIGVTRCTITMTGLVAGTWNDGASFVTSSQNLINVPGGESSTRRLEAVIPFYANTPDTSRLGGWDLETSEIRVVNSGVSRTVAEIDFFATDANGNVSTASTQTIDLVPGAGATLRPSAPGIGSQIPGGSIGWAGVFSIIPNGQVTGGLYSLSNLVATITLDAINAGGARTIINGVPREEVIAPNGTSFIPLAFRNYGGTAAKWSSEIVVANLGSGTTVTFTLFSKDTRGNNGCQGGSGCIINRTVNAGGIALLNLGDNSDPDVAQLNDQSTWTVVVSAGVSPANTLVFPGVLPNVLPAGLTVQAINVSVVGKVATSATGFANNTVSGFPTVLNGVLNTNVPGTGATSGMLILPLLFKNYNCSAADLANTQSSGTPCGWDSGISVDVTSPLFTGGSSTDYSIGFYDRAGQFLGNASFSVSQGNSTRNVYLPTIAFIPDGYSGSAVVRTASNSNPGFPISGNFAVQANHTNYGRNQAIAYNGVDAATASARAEAVGEIPCTSAGFTDCLWVANMRKSASVPSSNQVFSSGTGNVPTGINTGVRVFNPDIPALMTVSQLPGVFPGVLTQGATSGSSAIVTMQYSDDSGFIYGTAQEQIAVPALGTATFFPLYNGNLPGVFTGSARITATGNFIVAVANVVDYSVTDHDASGAFNPQYHNGRTQ